MSSGFTVTVYKLGAHLKGIGIVHFIRTRKKKQAQSSILRDNGEGGGTKHNTLCN